MDSYYALRRESKGSVLSATVLYAVFAVVNVSSAFVTGFLFSTVDPTTFSLGMNLVTLFAPLFLWVLANYLVSSISDGEGRLRDVYTGTVYALAPLIIFLLPLSLVTRALTLNERFVWDFGMNILLAWSGLNLFLMVKEVHGYRVGETVRTILVTLFAMAIFALAAFVLYILVDQVRDFVYSIVQEVRIRG